MKRLIIILLLFSIVLAGCAMQEPATGFEPFEEAEEPEVEEEPEAVEEPEVEEEPEAIEEPEVEEEPEAVEEPEEEEEPEVETALKSFEVMEGDTITYDGSLILVEDINRYGAEVYMREGSHRIKLDGTRSPEIINDVEYEITANTFSQNSRITVSIKPLDLGLDEYLVRNGEFATVNGINVKLDSTKSESSRASGSAYFTIHEVAENVWINPGETKTEGGLEITLQRVFFKTRQYVVFKIVPA